MFSLLFMSVLQQTEDEFQDTKSATRDTRGRTEAYGIHRALQMVYALFKDEGDIDEFFEDIYEIAGTNLITRYTFEFDDGTLVDGYDGPEDDFVIYKQV
jgi:hypothetical protein